MTQEEKEKIILDRKNNAWNYVNNKCSENNIKMFSEDSFTDWYNHNMIFCHCEKCYKANYLESATTGLLNGYTKCISCGKYNVEIKNFKETKDLFTSKLDSNSLFTMCDICHPSHK